MDLNVIESYIKKNGRIEMPELQEQFTLRYSDTVKALSELEKKGVIKYRGGFAYEYEVCPVKTQSDADNQESAETGRNKRQEAVERSILLEMNRAMQAMREDKDERDEEEDSDEYDDEEDYDEYDDEDDDEDDDDAGADVEKSYEKFLERLHDIREKKEAEARENAEKIRNGIKKMPFYNAEDETFSISMRVSYPNGAPLLAKVVECDGAFFVSDCGRTIEYLEEFYDEETVKDYLRNVLAIFDCRLIENAVCMVINDADDLPCEVAFLINALNAMISEQYFSTYYMSKDLVNLADEIAAREDAALVVSAIEAIKDAPARTSFLQSRLNIGYARATYLFNTLIQLGLIVSNGSLSEKSDKVSENFVTYLKRRLDNKRGA